MPLCLSRSPDSHWEGSSWDPSILYQLVETYPDGKYLPSYLLLARHGGDRGDEMHGLWTRTEADEDGSAFQSRDGGRWGILDFSYPEPPAPVLSFRLPPPHCSVDRFRSEAQLAGERATAPTQSWGRVDVAVDLFPTGVGHPGGIWYPIKGSSARYARREQCLWRLVPLACYLKGLRVDGRVDVVGPCLHSGRNALNLVSFHQSISTHGE